VRGRLLALVLIVAGGGPSCARNRPAAPASADMAIARARRAFRHPGLLNDRAELAVLRARATGEEHAPARQAFDQLRRSGFAGLDYRPRPRASVWCGPYSNPNFGCSDEKDDAIAAYTHALLWTVTGERVHATKAAEILDAWAATLHDHGGHNAPLQSAWVASVMVRAAELVRHTSDVWPPDQIARFARLLERAYLPYVAQGMPTYNGNWELSMIEATMAMGVFLDDGALFDRAVAMWRRRVPAYFYLQSDGPRPTPPPGTDRFRDEAGLVEKWYGQRTFVDGLAQETCRDFGHTMYGLAAAVNAAEIAFHQGVDLYAAEARRLTAGMEFHARFLLGAPVPDWLCGGRLELGRVATFEIAYNHFHHRAGLALPETERLLREIARPTRADHHMVWETFTHGDLSARP
jgi:hypothetical protein